jgi:PAS domain S-box-containing protein
VGKRLGDHRGVGRQAVTTDHPNRIGLDEDPPHRSRHPLSDSSLDDQAAWALLDTSPDGIVLVDEAGRIALVNRQTEELFGYDRGDLLGRSHEDLLPESLREAHRAHRSRYLKEPRTRPMGTGLTLYARKADGSEFPVEISLSPFPTPAGVKVIATVRDVTERVEAEAEARQIRELLDATRDAVLIMDADTWRFRYVNQGAVAQSGYSGDELLAMTMLDLAPEFTARSLRELLAPLERGDQASIEFVTTHRRQDGVDIPVEIQLQVVLDDKSRPYAYVMVARDIRERVERERDLHQAEQELRMAVDRERIARDLHDLVIQRLFAAGLAIQVVSSRAARPEDEERLQGIVDELDDTIREIRSVIFGLQPRMEADRGLRSEILQVVQDEQPALGFEPHVRFDGLIDTAPSAIGPHVLASLREALSNVARHAHARSAIVTVSADQDLRLVVEDDGVGISPDAPAGNGLANLRARAEELAGTVRVGPGPQGGTRLEWVVPLRTEAVT